MTIDQAIILGIVQGLTEFLPVSSSGHLILIPSIFNWQIQDLSFDVALHFGTTLAVLIYYRKMWQNMIFSFSKDFPRLISNKSEKSISKRLNSLSINSKLLLYILLSIIPVALAGYILEDKIENVFRTPFYVAIFMFITSFMMFIADRIADKNQNQKFTLNEKNGIENNKKAISDNDAKPNADEPMSLKFKNVLLISLSQILALFPGTSRSGVTISTGLFLGYSRKDAANISFLLATPIILGASILKLPDLFSGEINLLTMFIGVLTSFIAGYIAVSVLIKYLRNHKLTIFIIYRLILATFILIYFYL